MLFLLVLPVISCVALLWRYLQIYGPSNTLMRHVRSAAPRWRTVLFLLALAVVLLVAMHVVSEAIGRGSPGWLNLLVFVLAWDAIKIGILAGMTCARCTLHLLRALRAALGSRPTTGLEA